MDIEIFKNHLKKYLSSDNIGSLMDAIKEDNPLSSILIDENKISKQEIIKEYPFLIPHPIADNVFIYDKNKYSLGKTLLFEIGAYYIFEPCSSLVNYFLNPTEDDLVLDLAAAPGGKTIHCSFLMHNRGQIISNEINSQRANILSSNVEKYGRKNVTVINEDSHNLLKNFKGSFSKIILDAPCSGSGMFRKESKMMDDWTLNKVESLSKLQKELILIAYDLLSPGGEMMYSTCSFSYEEDEEVIEYLLKNRDAILVDLPHIKGEYRSNLKQTIHLFPHLFQGEGHFLAKIKKPGLFQKIEFKYKQPLNYSLPPHLTEKGQVFISRNNDVYLSNQILPLNGLHVLRQGIKVGSIDKKLGLIYDNAFARIDLEILPKIDLNKEQTKAYILGLTIQFNQKDGYYILTYKQIPFGISKLTHGTLKNHYPKGLRKKL